MRVSRRSVLMRLRHAALALLLPWALAGCGDDGVTVPEDDGIDVLNPFFRADLSGARTLDIRAEGSPRDIDADQDTGSTAYAVVDVLGFGDVTGVIGYEQFTADSSQTIVVFIINPVEGTFDIEDPNDCFPGASGTCAIAVLQYEDGSGGDPDAESDYTFTGGTLTITALTADGMTGTLSGTAAGDAGSGETIQVQNGSFEVELFTETELGTLSNVVPAADRLGGRGWESVR